MSCPQCTHTMKLMELSDEGKKIYWCPRCGTYKAFRERNPDDVERPRLIDRIREADRRTNEMDCTQNNFLIPKQQWLNILEAAGITEDPKPRKD